MDPFTQAVLGGATAQLFFHRQLGRRAFVLGAIAGALPDLDVLYQADQWSGWRHHRGVTHSIFFPFIAGPVFGYIAWRLRQRKLRQKQRANDPPGHMWIYIWASILGILTHPLLDVMTSYGTQLLAPFSDQRFAINAIAVIDPVYTIPLAIAGALGLLRPRRVKLAIWAAAIALTLSNGFIGYAWYLNHKTEIFAAAQLRQEGLTVRRLTSYPTIFQAFLRRVLVETKGEVRVGYVSAWNPTPIAWQHYQQPQEAMITKLQNSEGGQILHWFSMARDYYRISHHNGQTIVEGHDLRYGLPGPAEFGSWGVRAVYDKDGNPVEPVTRFRIHPRVNIEGLKMIFNAALGKEDSLIFQNKDLRHAYRE